VKSRFASGDVALLRHTVMPSATGVHAERLVANLEMAEWCTWKVLAMARQLSPAARRLSASAC
jgi:hypothetical protein